MSQDDNQKPRKRPPPPRRKVERQKVWMRCRAKHGCDGNYAWKGLEFRLNEGGKALRYQCDLCKGSWHVTIGGAF